jgi:hypothetical protein
MTKGKADAVTIAAPTPWSARAAMIHRPLPARPINPDAAPKIASPTTNSRRRPTMSTALAPSSSRPPNTKVSASCTQDSSVVVRSNYS